MPPTFKDPLSVSTKDLHRQEETRKQIAKGEERLKEIERERAECEERKAELERQRERRNINVDQPCLNRDEDRAIEETNRALENLNIEKKKGLK